MSVAAHLVSVHPQDLKFQFELEKPSYCDLKVTNNTEHHVALKVKTTSPKKYFVRPNTGIVHPLDSCVIRVTLQAQREYPPNLQRRDKFLLQSTVVHPNTNAKELPPGTFDKEAGNKLEEYKLRVVYITPRSSYGEFRDGPNRNLDPDSETLKRRGYERVIGLSIKFAVVVGLIRITVGFILNKSLLSS